MVTFFLCLVGNDVFIASGSKDVFIRIWKISLKEGLVEKTDELKLEEQKFLCGKQGISTK